MIAYLHNAIFKVNIFQESLPSFWIMRSQRSRRRDKGLYRTLLNVKNVFVQVVDVTVCRR